MKKFCWIVFIISIASFTVNAQTFSLLKDVNPGTGHGVYSPGTVYYAKVNNQLFFIGNDGIHGNELWKTDGTPGGTQMVKDINPGTGSSNGRNFTNINGTLYFTPNDGIHGEELWKSDGTEAGTVMVKDINTANVITNGGPGGCCYLNGFIFFTADDGINGRELWRTDGTAAGTAMVKDIQPGQGGSFVSSIAVLNNILVFKAYDNAHGEELWKSDGTESGTVLLKEIIPGANGGFPQYVAVSNGYFYFHAAEGIHGNELWRTDGTEAGTVLVKDICPGSCQGSPRGVINNGTLILTARDLVYGTELWKTDGTEAGTILIKDINPGVADSYPFNFMTVNNLTYFGAGDGIHGGEIWKTDGTEAGTVLVKDIIPGTGSGGIYPLAGINNILYFSSHDMWHGNEIWRSDGTPDGTYMVQDIAPGDNFYPSVVIELNGKILVLGTTPLHGTELWVADIPFLGSLPLSLSDFKAQLSGNDGFLNWKTSSEQNTSHFEIERSVDGRNFVKTGTITASGNSAIEKQYSYTDRNITSLGSPVVYYRLKTTDADAKFTYSKIIAININNKEAVVMLYPNPVIENTALMISSSKKETIACIIVDQNGRIVQRKNLIVNEGSNSIPVETHSLVAGTYTISLTGEFTNKQLKFVKQ